MKREGVSRTAFAYSLARLGAASSCGETRPSSAFRSSTCLFLTLSLFSPFALVSLPSFSLFLSFSRCFSLPVARVHLPTDRSTSFKNDPLKPVRITPARRPISRSYFFLSSPLRRSFPGADARTSLYLPSSSPMLVFHGVNKARPGSSCHVIITGERAYLGLSFSLFFSLFRSYPRAGRRPSASRER